MDMIDAAMLIIAKSKIAHEKIAARFHQQYLQCDCLRTYNLLNIYTDDLRLQPNYCNMSRVNRPANIAIVNGLQ